MVTENATTNLALRDRSTAIGPARPGLETSIGTRNAVSVCTQPLRATVTRRRQRVNFRQRYESRGVDRYRDFVRATTQANGPTLNVMR